jgi:hypothetical protein
MGVGWSFRAGVTRTEKSAFRHGTAKSRKPYRESLSGPPGGRLLDYVAGTYRNTRRFRPECAPVPTRQQWAVVLSLLGRCGSSSLAQPSCVPSGRLNVLFSITSGSHSQFNDELAMLASTTCPGRKRRHAFGMGQLVVPGSPRAQAGRTGIADGCSGPGNLDRR